MLLQTNLQRETIELVRARRHYGLSAEAMAKSLGISRDAATARLQAARASIGGIVCLGRGAPARWVAAEYADAFVQRREAAYRRRNVQSVKRCRDYRRECKLKQRVVPASRRPPLTIAGPRSVFDLARMAA